MIKTPVYFDGELDILSDADHTCLAGIDPLDLCLNIREIGNEIATAINEHADLKAKLAVAVESLNAIVKVVSDAPAECPHEANYVISGACPCCGLISEMNGIAQDALAKIKEAYER